MSRTNHRLARYDVVRSARREFIVWIESNKDAPTALRKNYRVKWQELSFILAMLAIAATVLAVINGWITPASLGI